MSEAATTPTSRPFSLPTLPTTACLPATPATTARLPQVLDVLQLSRATLRKVKQNMWWAAGYNLVGLPLAAGALLPLAGISLTPSLSGGGVGGVVCRGTGWDRGGSCVRGGVNGNGVKARA